MYLSFVIGLAIQKDFDLIPIYCFGYSDMYKSVNYFKKFIKKPIPSFNECSSKLNELFESNKFSSEDKLIIK